MEVGRKTAELEFKMCSWLEGVKVVGRHLDGEGAEPLNTS